MRRDGLIHGGVVLVEPAALRRGKRIHVDRIEIDWRAGEVLEVHELAELVLDTLPAEQFALDADAVSILDVEPRLVGRDHALFENAALAALRRLTPAEAVRAFVDVQDVADAVAGAVLIVQIGLPQRLAGENVEIQSRAAVEEAGVREMQVRAEDAREVGALGVRHGAKGDGAGYVGRAFEIMSAGVHEQQAVRLERNVRLRRGGIVDDGGVRAVGADGVKAEIEEALLIGAACREIVGGGKLGHRHLADVLLEPVDEFRHGDAVLDVGVDRVLLLGLVLNGLHEHGGVRLIHHVDTLAELGDEAVVAHAFVEQDRLPGRDGGGIVVKALVGARFDVVFRKIGAKLLREDRILHKPEALLLRERKIGEHDGDIVNVAAADVQQPRDIVERREQMDARALLFHLGAHIRELVRGRAAGVFRRENAHRRVRQLGAVVPDNADKVFTDGELGVLLFRERKERRAEARVDDAAVKAERAALRQRRAQILHDRRHALLAHAVERHAGIFELALRLKEIAGVCPETGFARRNNGRAGAAGEAGDVRARFEVRANVFGFMEVRRGNDVHVDMALFHFPAQPGESFRDHGCSSLYFSDPPFGGDEDTVFARAAAGVGDRSFALAAHGNNVAVVNGGICVQARHIVERHAAEADELRRTRAGEVEKPSGHGVEPEALHCEAQSLGLYLFLRYVCEGDHLAADGVPPGTIELRERFYNARQAEHPGFRTPDADISHPLAAHAEREQRAEIIPVPGLAEKAAKMHGADILRGVKVLRRQVKREKKRTRALALRPAAGIDNGSRAQRGGILQFHALRRGEKGGRRHRRDALTARGKILRTPDKIVRFHSSDYTTLTLC